MCRDLSDFESVPIVEVNSENIKCLEPGIRSAISCADFIAIDCVSKISKQCVQIQFLIVETYYFCQELSGLGERSKINTRMMNERYENVGTVAKTR